jgi:hypothetical protein
MQKQLGVAPFLLMARSQSLVAHPRLKSPAQAPRPHSRLWALQEDSELQPKLARYAPSIELLSVMAMQSAHF